MPLYEYQCQECGHRLETMRRFSDPPLTECPRCNGLLEKLISAPAFQFKGSGWYVTDYAGKGGKEGKGGDAKSGDGNADSKSGDGKSDSKSDAKSGDSKSSDSKSASKSSDAKSSSSKPSSSD